MSIDSNLILRVKVPAPESKAGFKSVHTELDSISDKLKALTSTNWTIKVGIKVTGVSDIDKLVKALKKQGGKIGQEVGPTVNSPSFGPGSATAGDQTGRKVRVKKTDEGPIKTVTDIYEKNTPTHTQKTTDINNGNDVTVDRRLRPDRRKEKDLARQRFAYDVSRYESDFYQATASGSLVRGQGGKFSGSQGLRNDQIDSRGIRRSVAIKPSDIEREEKGDKIKLSAVIESYKNAKGEIIPIRRTVAEINKLTGEQVTYIERSRSGYAAMRREFEKMAEVRRKEAISANDRRRADKGINDFLATQAQYNFRSRTFDGSQTTSQGRRIITKELGNDRVRITAVRDEFVAANGQLLILSSKILEVNRRTGEVVEKEGEHANAIARANRELDRQNGIRREAATQSRRQANAQILGGATAGSGHSQSSVLYDENGNPVSTRSRNTTYGGGVKRTEVADEHGTRVTSTDDKQYHRLQQGRAAAAQHNADALAQGFTQRQYTQTTFRDNAGQQQVAMLREFSRTARDAQGNYGVLVRYVNESTGIMRERFLTGGAAIRYLGDSFLSSASKVALWTASTTAVFAVVSGFREAIRVSRELEKGTVFLSRVGKNLSDTDQGRIKAARQLTRDIVALAAATGADSIKSQQAASVFLRSGQDRVQTMQSVKATMLAARIAELDEVDAANLLSSAQLQFKLRAEETLPVLDSLNELSNKYRVSTNDLLQSISRTGSVAEEQNTKLTELAAITAVVSQRTARSGAEIGNALKTISSRLVAPEVSASLGKIGINLRSTSGESKSLGQVLLDLKTKFSSLTDAERDQLTVQIAGVRQRNILIAAIDGSNDSIVAEIAALRGSADAADKTGSAMSEFALTVDTLDSSIERLKQRAVSFASNSTGGLNELVKVLANNAAAAIGLLNGSFGRLLVTGGLLVGGFYLTRSAVGQVSRGMTALSAGTQFATDRQNALQAGLSRTASFLAAVRLQAGRAYTELQRLGQTGTVRGGAAAGAVTFASNAATGGLASAGRFARAAGPILALEAGIAVIMKLISSSEELASKEKILADKSTEYASAYTEAQNKKLQATRVAANSIIAISSAVANGEYDQVKAIEDVIKIASAARIEIPVTIKLGTERGDRDVVDIINKSLKSTSGDKVRAIENQIIAKERELDELNRKSAEAQDYQRYYESAGAVGSGGGVIGHITGLFGIAGDYLSGNRERGKHVVAGEAAITESAARKASDELIELKKRKQAASDERFDIDKDDSIAKLTVKIARLVNSFDDLEKARKVSKAASGLAGEDSDTLRSLRNSRKDFAAVDQVLLEMQGKFKDWETSSDYNVKAVREQFKKLKEQVEDDALAIGKALTKNLVDNIKEVRKIQSTITDARDANSIRLNAIPKENSSERTSLDIELAKRDRIKQKLDENLQSRPSSEAEQIANKQEAERLAIALRDQELKLLEQAYTLEESITQKRYEYAKASKEATKEILRGVNGLSEEDKLRLIIQKGEHGKDPNRKLTQTDLFNMGAANANIAQSFFAANIKPVGDDLTATAFTNSLTNQSMVDNEEKRKKLEEDQRRLNEVSGGSTATFSDQQQAAAVNAQNAHFNIANVNLVANMSISIGVSSSFDRLIDAFQVATDKKLGQLEEKFAAQVRGQSQHSAVAPRRAASSAPE